MSSIPDDNRLSERLKIVEEHIRFENLHDLDKVMQTFGKSPRYDVVPSGDQYMGHEQVRAFYAGAFSGLPDLKIDVKNTYATEEAVILEVIISGTHLGPFRNIPPTGKRIEYPLCAIYTFDEENKLAGEKIYYDSATVLRQLGILPEA